MALIQCPNCGKMISEYSQECPFCKSNIVVYREKKNNQTEEEFDEEVQKALVLLKMEKKKIKCPECGSSCEEDDVECAKCGFPISNAELMSEAKERNDTINELENDSKEGGIAAFSLIALFGIAFSIWAWKEADSDFVGTVFALFFTALTLIALLGILVFYAEEKERKTSLQLARC